MFFTRMHIYTFFIFMIGKVSADYLIANKLDSFQINDIITQLLRSDQFNKLVDEIAAKTADKIRNMEPINTAKLEQYSLKNKELQNITERAEINPINKREKEKSDSLTRNRLTNTKKTAKIDSQAFLQKQLPSRELELNFKHLTRTLEKQKQENEGRHENGDKSHKETIIEHHENKNHSDVIRDISRSSEEDNKMKTVAKKSLESKNFISQPITGDSKYEEFKHEKSTFHEKNYNGWSSDGTNLSEEDSNNFINQDTARFSHDEDNKQRKSITYDSKEVFKVGIYRALSDDNLVSPKNMNHEALSEEQSNENVKRLVRNENGKLYLYNSSPDYADYHERRVKELINKS